MKVLLKGIDVELDVIEFDNGFKIYYINDDISDKYYASIACFYGGDDVNINSRYVPSGIAHFIEHMMFNMRDGSNPFEFYSKSSCEINATTSSNVTRYYINGNSNFYDNLDYLINLVFDPVFNDDNVLKERNVILEEANMYLNDVYEKMYCDVLSSLFNSKEYSVDVIGTKDSISIIDADILYFTYNYFYKCSNMALFLKGNNLDLDRVVSIFNNNSYFKLREGNCIKSKIDEKDYVNNNLIKLYDDVSINKANLFFKIDISKFKYDKIVIKYYLDMFLNILFDSTSDYYDIMLNKSNVYNFSSNVDIKGDYAILDLNCETDDCDKFRDFVFSYLDKFKYSDVDVDRFKKVFIAECIRMSDNKIWTLNSVLNDLVNYNKVIDDKISIIRELNFSDFDFIVKGLDFSNYCFAVILKK